MTKHTQEPWLAEGAYVITQGESYIAYCNLIGPNGEISRENARRIVACVNACAGVTNEELEHGVSLLESYKSALDLVKSQRDELLAEVDKQIQWMAHIMPQVQAPDSVMLGFSQAIKALKAVSAKAKGGTKPVTPEVLHRSLSTPEQIALQDAATELRRALNCLVVAITPSDEPEALPGHHAAYLATVALPRARELLAKYPEPHNLSDNINFLAGLADEHGELEPAQWTEEELATMDRGQAPQDINLIGPSLEGLEEGGTK